MKGAQDATPWTSTNRTDLSTEGDVAREQTAHLASYPGAERYPAREIPRHLTNRDGLDRLTPPPIHRGPNVLWNPDPDFGLEIQSERTVPLGTVLPAPKDKLIYEYDFGDSWEHEVVLEKVVAPDPATRYPICLTGKRACPPEDCGGIWGYAEFLDAIVSPDHSEHDTMLEWSGGEFDPEQFDLAEVNRMLGTLR